MHAYNERHHSSDGAHGRRTKPRQENRDRTCPQGRPSPRTTYLVSDVLASSERAWRFQDIRTRALKNRSGLILSEYLYSFARRQCSRSAGPCGRRAPLRPLCSNGSLNLFAYRLVVVLGTAAVPCGSDAGLSQQACTRLFKVSVALSSIFPCRTTQRKAAWIWPEGQPNRS